MDYANAYEIIKNKPKKERKIIELLGLIVAIIGLAYTFLDHSDSLHNLPKSETLKTPAQTDKTPAMVISSGEGADREVISIPMPITASILPDSYFTKSSNSTITTYDNSNGTTIYYNIVDEDGDEDCEDCDTE